MVTASKIPVPEPMAPMKSAKIERAPIQTPPKAAAVGIYWLRYLTMEVSLIPSIKSSWSINCLATSLELDPETSIQILEKKAQDERTKIV